MSKKNIIIGFVAFLVGFGATFYIIRTYLPKNKVEKTVSVKETPAKPE